MARLPQPGGDNGNWGAILNEYLSQSHKADGAIKDNAVTASALAPNSVTNAALASGSISATAIVDSSLTKGKLSNAVQTSLDKADSAIQALDLASYVPKWKANTVYTAGQSVVSPSSDIVTANASFTSGGSYVASNWTVSSTFVQQAVGSIQKIGNGGDPNSSQTQDVKLLVTANRTNPDKVIEQHFVGYSFYSGTPGAGVGTLQGGSSESYAYANGSTDMGAVLGFEGIGNGSGDNASRKISNIVGMQGTSLAAGIVNVDLMVSLRARGPAGSGTGTIAEARSLDVQEPIKGTVKRSIYSIGTSRFRQGTTTNTVEVASSADTLQLALTGSKLTAYASDGTSARAVVNGADSVPNGRFISELFSAGKHISLKNNSTEVFGINFDGTVSNYAGGVLRMTTASAVLTAYASDGSSKRAIVDGNDATPNGRFISELFGSGKHVSFKNNSSEVFSVTYDGTVNLGAAGLKFASGLESTGSGAAQLGSNSPATTLTAPYRWVKVTTSDGSTGYVPLWK